MPGQKVFVPKGGVLLAKRVKIAMARDNLWRASKAKDQSRKGSGVMGEDSEQIDSRVSGRPMSSYNEA
jgi:hypothetical protein